MAKRKGGRKRPMETRNNQEYGDAKEKRILQLESENIKLKEQLQLMRTEGGQLASEGAEVFEKTAKAVADLIRPKKHLAFHLLVSDEKKKTKVFDVVFVSEYDKTLLGKIYWYVHWRQYVFEPARETPTIWSEDCLLELQKFLSKLKIERKKGIISIDHYDGKVLGIKKDG